MRPALRTSTSENKNHANLNAIRRWALDAFNIRNLIITPNAVSPNSKIDIKADLAAARSVGGEVAIKATATTPAIDLTLDTGITGVGGLDAGELSTNSLYAIFLAAKAETENGIASSIGVIASSDWQSPALPAGWTHKRLIGALPSQEDPTSGEPVIKLSMQQDDWFSFYEAQKAKEWAHVSEAEGRTALDLSKFMPPVCEEVRIDAQVYGGTAPFHLKIFEHHTGFEVIDLNPGTEDFGHESKEIFAPQQLVDYSLGVTDIVVGSIRVIGFRMPIDMEF
jgi:hypothetical protein